MKKRKGRQTVTVRMKNPQGHLSAGSVYLRAQGRQIYGHLQSSSVAGVSTGERVKSRGNVSGSYREGTDVKPYRDTYMYSIHIHYMHSFDFLTYTNIWWERGELAAY